MQKYLISFANGACGNLVAALIYCLKTDQEIPVREFNGSMHQRENFGWSRVSAADHDFMSTSNVNIFITHDIVSPEAFKDITVINIKFEASSQETITKLSVGKNLKNTQQWLQSTNQASTAKDAMASICCSIDYFLQNNQFHGHCLNFEDIWHRPRKFLHELSAIVQQPINQNAINLLNEYRQINSRLYNIKLSEGGQDGNAVDC